MSFYFLARGECEVLIKDSLSKKVYVEAVLYGGCSFGEISLLTLYPRTATVKTLNFGTLAELSRKSFN